MASDKELLGASTSLMVLAILEKEPLYGYELLKRINAESGGMFDFQEGTLYPFLHRLEAGGLLRKQWQDSPAGRKRKYYYITAKGRKHLAESASQWHALHAMVSRVLGGAHDGKTAEA